MPGRLPSNVCESSAKPACEKEEQRSPPAFLHDAYRHPTHLFLVVNLSVREVNGKKAVTNHAMKGPVTQCSPRLVREL